MEVAVVRNGAEATPRFGYLEVASIALAETATSDADGGGSQDDGSIGAVLHAHACARRAA
jgi:hypothetical protein